MSENKWIAVVLVVAFMLYLGIHERNTQAAAQTPVYYTQTQSAPVVSDDSWNVPSLPSDSWMPQLNIDNGDSRRLEDYVKCEAQAAQNPNSPNFCFAP